MSNKFLQKFSPQTLSLLLSEQIYLFGLVGTLALLHLRLLAAIPGENEELPFYVIGWGSIIYLLWNRNSQQNRPHRFSSFLGLAILVAVFARPLNLWKLDIWLLRFSTVFAGLGVGLLAFGFQGLLLRWRCLLILCLMAVPFGNLNNIFINQLQWSNFTTASTAFFLHYLGWKTTYQDAFLTIPTGTVEVYYICTGGQLIVWLLRLSLLVMIISQLSGLKKLGLIAFSVIIGIIVGCFRVGLLANLVNEPKAFDYWHGEDGSQIFFITLTIAFVCFCNWLLYLEEMDNLNEEPEESQGDITSETPDGIVKPKWHLRLLAGTWAGLVVSAIIFTAFPALGRRTLSVYNPPDTLSLNSWKLVSAENFNTPNPDTNAIAKVEGMASGKEYKYLKSDKSLSVEMRYVVNTKCDAVGLWAKLRGKKLSVKQTDKILLGSKLGSSGYYLLTSDEKQAYLIAAINPRGGSTVTWAQFNNNRNRYDFTGSRLGTWLLGNHTLKDNRCLWVQLSTPVDGTTKEDAYKTLESVWTDNYSVWRSHFQSLK